MTQFLRDGPEPADQKFALAQWDHEGGAGRFGPKASTAGLPPSAVPEVNPVKNIWPPLEIPLPASA